MTDFPTLTYMYTSTCKILTHFIYLKHGKGKCFGWSLPVWVVIGSTLPPFLRMEIRRPVSGHKISCTVVHLYLSCTVHVVNCKECLRFVIGFLKSFCIG